MSHHQKYSRSGASPVKDRECSNPSEEDTEESGEEEQVSEAEPCHHHGTGKDHYHLGKGSAGPSKGAGTRPTKPTHGCPHCQCQTDVDNPGKNESRGPPAWKPNTPYNDGDIVEYDGIIYRCTRNNTSSPTQPPPYAPGSWRATAKPASPGSGSTPTPIPVGDTTSSPTVVNDLILPYASELFGVYQPFIGWKSELSQESLSNAVLRRVQEAARHASLLVRPEIPRRVIAMDRTGTEIGRAMAQHVSQEKVKSVNDLISHEPATELRKIFKPALKTESRSRAASDARSARREEHTTAFTLPDNFGDPTNEKRIAAVIQQLSIQEPLAVDQLFRPGITKLDRALGAASFYAGNHPSKEVYLSPIGLLHQFREYFFQLGTFLGPPVGHIWISPGGTVELVEVNTRKQIMERMIEDSQTTTTKTESTTTNKDELADAVKNENQNDMKLGASATASGGIGSVFQASGTASFNLGTSRTQAQESTHKQMREQSSKLSSEVTQNYKTTFRTVTETTDTSSRRYVMQNTSNRLVSYELSRKMRKVAVQVQDLGQRLCFQLFVENPGNPLGVGEFVYAKGDSVDPSLKVPEDQPEPLPKLVTVTDTFPYIVTYDDRELDGDFYPDPENPTGGIHHESGKQSRIDFIRQFKLPPPPDGYDFGSIKHCDFRGAAVKWLDDLKVDAVNQTYQIQLTYVNFGGADRLPFDLQVEYLPDATTKQRVIDKNNAAKKEYDDQVADSKEKIFYDTLRTRLKLVGQVQSRAYDVLREEERHVIYSNIIKKLYGDETGFQKEDYYAASEMIRYFFDIDALLYFVAPDWWKPQSFQLASQDDQGRSTSSVMTKEPLSVRASLVGTPNNTKANSVRPTYLMTEETAPAPMGASLGWLMQVDGDSQRNAFLNSPWVKAVVPIRPGRERDAIGFLKRKEVAGMDGLDKDYNADPPDDPDLVGKTFEEIFLKIADSVKKEYDQSLKPQKIGKDKVDEDGNVIAKAKRALPTEKVFAHGFDPLDGGIDFTKGAFEVFSEWTEILPTDQVVATEYSLQGL